MPQHRLVVTLPGEIRVTDDGQVYATLVLGGDIDEETYPALVEALSRIPRDSAGLHVDLSAVTFCDLAGLRAIVGLAESTTPVILARRPWDAAHRDENPGLGPATRARDQQASAQHARPEMRLARSVRRESGPAGIGARTGDRCTGYSLMISPPYAWALSHAGHARCLTRSAYGSEGSNISVGCNLPDPPPGGPISMLPSCPVKLHGSDRATVLPAKRGWGDPLGGLVARRAD